MKKEELQQILTAHINEEQGHITEIKTDIKNIKENHLAHIQISMEGMKTDTEWLKRFFWIIATASIGGLVTSLINLVKTVR